MFLNVSTCTLRSARCTSVSGSERGTPASVLLNAFSRMQQTAHVCARLVRCFFAFAAHGVRLSPACSTPPRLRSERGTPASVLLNAFSRMQQTAHVCARLVRCFFAFFAVHGVRLSPACSTPPRLRSERGTPASVLFNAFSRMQPTCPRAHMRSPVKATRAKPAIPTKPTSGSSDKSAPSTAESLAQMANQSNDSGTTMSRRPPLACTCACSCPVVTHSNRSSTKKCVCPGCARSSAASGSWAKSPTLMR
jgi:hypothetical protein